MIYGATSGNPILCAIGGYRLWGLFTLFGKFTNFGLTRARIGLNGIVGTGLYGALGLFARYLYFFAFALIILCGTIRFFGFLFGVGS